MRWRGVARQMAEEGLEPVRGMSRAAKGISRDTGCHAESFRPRVASFGIKVAGSGRQKVSFGAGVASFGNRSNGIGDRAREIREAAHVIGEPSHPQSAALPPRLLEQLCRRGAERVAQLEDRRQRRTVVAGFQRTDVAEAHAGAVGELLL